MLYSAHANGAFYKPVRSAAPLEPVPEKERREEVVSYGARDRDRKTAVSPRRADSNDSGSTSSPQRKEASAR